MSRSGNGLWHWLKRLFQRGDSPSAKEGGPKIVIPEVVIQKTGQGQTAVSHPSTSSVDPIFLRQQMSNHLDAAQLTTMGETIGLDYAALPGGKGRKVLALVTAFEKEGQLTRLLALCQQQNSEIEWQMEKNDE
ncbi:MAG: hypothetical protein CL608_18405 [Anaerolineaceae bacterium]|nr:hypothetical protein [Anaerolineaceae bacterium]